jgi:hypothetical protein
VQVLALAIDVAASASAGFVELGGSGGLGSINATTPIRGGPIDLRVGLSVLPVDRNVGVVLIVPVMAEAHTAGRWQVAGGVGQGLSITTAAVPWARGLASAGVRYVPPNGRVWAGVAYTPLVSYLLDLQLQHWAGVQIGWKP